MDYYVKTSALDRPCSYVSYAAVTVHKEKPPVTAEGGVLSAYIQQQVHAEIILYIMSRKYYCSSSTISRRGDSREVGDENAAK